MWNAIQFPSLYRSMILISFLGSITKIILFIIWYSEVYEIKSGWSTLPTIFVLTLFFLLYVIKFTSIYPSSNSHRKESMFWFIEIIRSFESSFLKWLKVCLIFFFFCDQILIKKHMKPEGKTLELFSTKSTYLMFIVRSNSSAFTTHK